MVDKTKLFCNFVNQKIMSAMKQVLTDIFSKRLKQARVMKGFSLETLAKSINNLVSRQAINKYEQGKMLPDSKVLIALSSTLGVNADFFFRPFSIEVGQLDFRKKAKFPESKAKILKERVQEELERYIEAEQLCNIENKFSLVRKEVSSIDDAIKFAMEIRGELGLGTDGISNVIEVLEDNGIKIIEIEESEEFDGLCGYANNVIPVIVLNSSLTAEQKRFTALHELSHLLMILPPEKTSKEKEALCNAFAGEMLIPHSVLINRIGEKRHDISLSELTDIQAQFGVSIDSMMFMLHQYGVITDNRYKTFNIKKNVTENFKNEVNKSRIPEERSRRFFRMVYRALANEIISISKASSLLNLPVNQINLRLQLV
ncbi:MAG: ImmA/IrrE family metallo-endopeptidase [Muribaculaceae bacterium]|nr:ImmA/IrrE family metallo-endopeptidase [Muribaculaceae bacterium]